MLKLVYGKRGQSSLEICILIVCIIGALIAMQVYIKRAIQGRLRLAADDIGEQYSPGNTYSWSTTNITGFTSIWAKTKPRGNEGDSAQVETTVWTDEATRKNAYEKVRTFKHEDFP